jgi:hypothetical protein
VSSSVLRYLRSVDGVLRRKKRIQESRVPLELLRVSNRGAIKTFVYRIPNEAPRRTFFYYLNSARRAKIKNQKSKTTRSK